MLLCGNTRENSRYICVFTIIYCADTRSFSPGSGILADESASAHLLEDRIDPTHFGIDKYGYNHDNSDSESQDICAI